MNVETVDIATLTLDPANVRKHGERNLEAIKGSLAKFGQQKPIVVGPKGVVVAGNGTLDAARALGWTKLDVVRTDLAGAEAMAFAIADNRTAELAEWDGDLAESMAALRDDESIDHLLTGFTDAEIDELIADATDPGSVVEDEVPEPPDEPTTKPGDLWILGEHRVLCGDSRLQIGAVLGDWRVDTLVTDPPYGVSYVGKTDEALTIDGDDDAFDGIVAAAFGDAVGRTRHGATWFVFCPPGPKFASFARILAELDVWRQTLVWVKDSLVLGHSDYHYKLEAILYGWTPGGSHHTPRDRKQTTVWEYDRPKASREHPTMKPVGLVAYALEQGSDVGNRVLDPFLGSGPTLIAAEQLNRRCYGLEIEPKYCDVIVDRWEKLTGKTAERVADG